jgi:hypothetical protein
VFSISLLYIMPTLKRSVAYLTTFSESDTTLSKVLRFMNNDFEIILHERIPLLRRYIGIFWP